MAIISIDKINPSEDGGRWDAEYFANDYRDFITKAFSAWPRWTPLREAAAKLTSGHTPLKHDVDTGDCDFLTVECVSPLTIHFDLAKKVWRTAVDGELRRVRLVKDDVLITIKRRIVDSCPITKTYGPTAVNQDLAVMTPNKQFLPAFVSAFLSSRIGKFQAFRVQTEQMNPYLSVGGLGTLLLPIVSLRDQEKVASIVSDREDRLAEAEDLYKQAEQLLLSSLKLDDANSNTPLFFTRSFGETLEAGRFDAEYFSPRYQDVLARLRKGGLSIGDVASLARRKFKPIQGGTFRYIEIGGLTGSGEAQSVVLETSDAPSRAQWVVQPDDVITSTVRPIRRLSALIGESQAGNVCSSGFAVLSPNAIEPEVLLTYLRLRIVSELLDLYSTASMYPAISEERLLQIPIALPSKEVRSKIVGKIQSAFAARREAGQLLEDAKSAVEGLILRSGKMTR